MTVTKDKIPEEIGSYVHIVGSTCHNDDWKRPETTSFVMGVYEDKETAIRHAADRQFEYLEEMDKDNEFEHLKDVDDIKRKLSEIKAMDSGEAKLEAALELLDHTLPEPVNTMRATQTRYKVVSVKLNCSMEGQDWGPGEELCFFRPNAYYW
ncbi:hypothetical protein BGX21_007286 [Mortierella sp. AD011]|nr:hypothetical protein BGX20_001280 [Mortierella sp. AD010]KAF9398788.1 hypothetical protein BGX21_007286 [Mortierella sp. AD011]